MREKRKKSEPADDAHVGVRLKESLRHRAKVFAAQSKRDLQEILDEAVAEYLKRRGA